MKNDYTLQFSRAVKIAPEMCVENLIFKLGSHTIKN